MKYGRFMTGCESAYSAVFQQNKKTPNGIMDGFFKKVNQKLKLGRKNVTKEVRVASLARDTPTSPYLCLYQILSKYFKPLRSYKVYKNLA